MLSFYKWSLYTAPQDTRVDLCFSTGSDPKIGDEIQHVECEFWLRTSKVEIVREKCFRNASTLQSFTITL